MNIKQTTKGTLFLLSLCFQLILLCGCMTSAYIPNDSAMYFISPPSIQEAAFKSNLSCNVGRFDSSRFTNVGVKNNLDASFNCTNFGDAFRNDLIKNLKKSKLCKTVSGDSSPSHDISISGYIKELEIVNNMGAFGKGPTSSGIVSYQINFRDSLGVSQVSKDITVREVLYPKFDGYQSFSFALDAMRLTLAEKTANDITGLESIILLAKSHPLKSEPQPTSIISQSILASGQTASAQQITTIAAGSVKDDLLLATPHGKTAGKYDIAVVIGNANYSSTGTPNVDFALQDAQAMKEYLIKTFGYDPANIIYIENATLTKLNEVFGIESNYQGKLYKWVRPGKSKIFIYYVGHGAPDQHTGEGYFVPVDANPQYISTSGYKLSTFYENLSKIPATQKTVVIDACFSGSSANGQLLKGVSGLTARLKSEPKATIATDLLLTSAGMDQVASWYPEKGHSLFTYFFLKGIQGDADSNKDGKITMGEMKAWLNDQVPYMARRLTGNEQQPVIMGKDGDELVNLTR